MKKVISLLLLVVSTFAMTSCFTSYVASYNVGLSKVESPSNAKQQFGETKVVKFEDGGLTKYRYEDDFIDIAWSVSPKQFNFDLRNKSGHTIKINWDDVSYVAINGKVGRVMHAGVKYTERNNSQPATTIPKNASISDLLLPTDNVFYVSGQYGGWREEYLIPCVYSKQEHYDLLAPLNVGQKMRILMPIMIENVQNDYVFEFNIDELLPQKK